MKRVGLVVAVLATLALLGLALYSLGRDDEAAERPSSASQQREPVARPERKAAKRTTEPRPVSPPTAAPTPPAARLRDRGAESGEGQENERMGWIDSSELEIVPTWSAPLKASAVSCQRVINRLDVAVAAGGKLAEREKKELYQAARDNLAWLSENVDAEDPDQVSFLEVALAQTKLRMKELKLEPPLGPERP